MRRLLAVLFVVPLIAGCLGQVEPDVSAPADVVSQFQVVDADGDQVPQARVAAYANGSRIAVDSADADGVYEVAELPVGTERVGVAGPNGSASYRLPALPATVRLTDNASEAAGDVLAALEPVPLECPQVDPPPYSCGRFGEPVVEVASDGRIWASATCCIGRAPPIWTSTDGGESFQLVTPRDNGATEAVRQAYGIEGDFAIDDAGNVYFFDIALGGDWLTSYDKDAQHRHTVAHPFPPLVDRPWVRAAAEDEVFILYNTGSQTRFYPSDDGGKTFDYTAGHVFPCYVGTFGQGPTRSDLLVAANCGGDQPMLWLSHDKGQTWSDGEEVPMPDSHQADMVDPFMPPVADEAGNVYVAFTDAAGEDGEQKRAYVARRSPDGNWSGPWPVSPPGLTEKPWIAAGSGGRIAVAYYHADVSARNESEAKWELKVSASIDAQSTDPHFQTVTASDEVLHTGGWSRSLGDFLQIDVTPDGRLAVVYGENTQDGGLTGEGMNVRNRFVASAGHVDFTPSGWFLNGP